MRVSCRFTLVPHGEYRVGTGPHARQSWGADAPVSRPGPPPDLGTRQGHRVVTVIFSSFFRIISSEFSMAAAVCRGRSGERRKRVE